LPGTNTFNYLPQRQEPTYAVERLTLPHSNSEPCQKHLRILLKLAKDKHSSQFCRSIRDEENSLNSVGTGQLVGPLMVAIRASFPCVPVSE